MSRLPWYSHLHNGDNTHVMHLGTPHGTFVRSWKGETGIILFYPLDNRFVPGATRTVTTVLKYDRAVSEQDIDLTVIDFMHAHPAMCTYPDAPQDEEEVFAWQVLAEGAVSVLETSAGAFVRHVADDRVRIEFTASSPAARSAEVCNLASNCGVETALARADRRVSRFIAQKGYARTPAAA